MPPPLVTLRPSPALRPSAIGGGGAYRPRACACAFARAQPVWRAPAAGRAAALAARRDAALRPVLRHSAPEEDKAVGDAGLDGEGEGLAAAIGKVTSSKLYSWGLEGVVLVGLLGLIDAAYSGDWSRIGAITVEDEERLKGLVTLVGLVHLVLGPSAGLVASKKGLPWQPAFAKTMLVGFLAFVEVCFQPQESSS